MSGKEKINRPLIKGASKNAQGKVKLITDQFALCSNLRVAIAQMNSVVGDFRYNQDCIQNCLKEATEFGADLILFPELALTGYPPEDLLLKKDFIEKNKKILKNLASRVKGIVAVIGYVEKVKINLYNSAALIHGGKILGNYRKMILPNYGVFDEKRYFI